MEADWEVEIGGGAAVIEADWPGFIPLRSHPDRIVDVAEAAVFPPLATLLLALNAGNSPLWTSKCDLWQPEPAALAIYIDLLPLNGRVFAAWQQAEAFCREYIARLTSIPQKSSTPESSEDRSVNLVVRQAIAGNAEGFGITAYLSAKGADQAEAGANLALAMADFADAIPSSEPPETAASKLQ